MSRGGPEPVAPGQYDICQLPDGMLAVVVQSDLLAPMASRVVVPLLPLETAGPPIAPLNPVLTFGTEQLKLMPQMMVTLPLAALGRRIGSIAHMRADIESAVSVMLSGL